MAKTRQCEGLKIDQQSQKVFWVVRGHARYPKQSPAFSDCWKCLFFEGASARTASILSDMHHSPANLAKITPKKKHTGVCNTSVSVCFLSGVCHVSSEKTC